MKQILLTSIAVAFAMLASAQERVIKCRHHQVKKITRNSHLKTKVFGGLLMLVCLHL